MKKLIKYSRLVIVPTMITLSMGSYAEEITNDENDMVDCFPDISEARTRLQTDYISKVGEESFKFINNYQEKYNRVVSEKLFNKFVNRLLKNGEDTIIKTIHYMPEQSFTIVMHSSPFVEPTLGDKTFIYNLVKRKWGDNSKEETESSDSAAPFPTPPMASVIQPYAMEPFRSMRVITDYCQKPEGYTYLMAGSWSDRDWCPLWHTVVMPLQDFFANEAKLAAPASTPSIDINLTEPSRSKHVITNYCNNPQGYRYPMAGSWSDIDWCPVWHTVVMPLQ
ncbi:hypothetical protein [Candidatus Parabeggiatoa sp. HSG14]|uniref:hypothetical protein n=1 Tax=Candidatus Parabeggiatoa sp. HSG14 TaxID=3055593 RepID=UPI0025A7175A|nr:hypothetical protein [Thiotrichales bacterium HSG14]